MNDYQTPKLIQALTIAVAFVCFIAFVAVTIAGLS